MRKISSQPELMDEIPEARRDAPATKGALSQSTGLVWVGIAIAGLGLLGITIFFSLRNSALTPTAVAPVETPAPEPTPVEEPPATEPNQVTAEHILGHLAYDEAPTEELVAVTADGWVQLRPAAADRFLQMQRDARVAGIRLEALSGFRSIEQQNQLFFAVKEQRSQDASKRAEVSAPPGYSEHHTGYAVDIGDGNVPDANVSVRFEQTAAFDWLQRNAARYSFELSFPEDNLQGISYEPWHWRFVGDIESLETFYKANNLQAPLKPQE